MTWRRAGEAAVLALFAVPLASLTLEPTLPLLVKAMAGIVFVVTAARPGLGLCLVAGLLRLAPALHAWSGSLVGGHGVAQAMVLPLLVAGFGRLAFSHDDRPGRLGPPAWLLAAVIAACGVTLTAAELAYASLPQVGLQTLEHAGRDFFAGTEAFGDLHRAAAWIEALALAVLVERTLRGRATLARSVVRMALIGGAAAALFSANRVAELAIGSADPIATVARAFQEYRFNPFYADLNAAGSLQVLFLVPALWIAGGLGERWVWITTIPLTVALWFSGSRAALAATFVGAAVAWWLAHRLPKRWWLVLVAALVGTAAFVAWSGRPGRASIGQALAIRWDLGVLGLRVAATEPVLGVGVGRMYAASAPLVTADIARRYPPATKGDNAHNNFVQVLAESGVIGLVAFLWLIAIAVGGARESPGSTPATDRPGAIGGLVAFLLTCLAGHPLLNDNVRFCFFLWIGIAAAGVTRPVLSSAGSRASRWVIVAALLIVAAVLPMRVAADRRAANLRGVIVGASAEMNGEDGVGYRLAEPVSSWFVRATTTLVELPLRADTAQAAPCRVEIDVDGQPASVVSVDADAWRAEQLLLPPAERGRGSRRLDLRVKTEGCRLRVGPLVAR